MFIIKSLIIFKRLIHGLIVVIVKPIFFVFKLFFSKSIIRLYHLIFRFKKSGLAESPWHEIIRKKALHFSVLSLTVIITIFNIYSYNIGIATASSTASKTIIFHLIKNEFSIINDNNELIEESLNIQQILTAGKEKYRDPRLAVSNRAWVSDVEEKNIADVYTKGLLQNNNPFGSGEIKSDINNENNNVRTETIYYTVASGDNISSIAKKFGLNVNTVLWANNLSAFSLIRPGNSLAILPTNGVMHTVKSGDTVGHIANKYGVDESSIFTYNNIKSANSLKIGQSIVIPGGKKIVTKTIQTVAKTSGSKAVAVIEKLTNPKQAPESGALMLWPTEGHRITQYYSWRHTGLDIANKVGTPLYAADSGTIVYSGWSTGYGNNVLIDHGNGKRTRYAHASKLFVKVGDKVARGEEVAAMGSTGWSTGPHIHFEVIVNGVRENPLSYIR